MQIPLTPIALTALTNTALACVMSVIPPLRAWFVRQSSDWQTAIFGISAIALGCLFMFLSCQGFLGGLACERNSLTDYFVSVVLSSIGGMRAAAAAFTGIRLINVQPILRKRGEVIPIVPSAARPKMLD